MGISIDAIKALAEIFRNMEFPPRRIMTIGRQGLPDKQKSLAYMMKQGILSSAHLEKAAGVVYFDELCALLGIQVDSMDCSDYENATIIHDMNKPVPAKLKNKYDVVIDGGALEHIFNFPVAIRNCMEMTARGGYFLSISNANNYMGHGLYQFSPDLYYRTLCKANGFSMQYCRLLEHRLFRKKRRYVKDPAAVGKRVEIINRYQTSIYVLARRLTGNHSVLAAFPAQSDYVVKWTGKGGGSFLSRMYARLSTRSPRLSNFLTNIIIRYYLHTFHNHSFYSRKPPGEK